MARNQTETDKEIMDRFFPNGPPPPGFMTKELVEKILKDVEVELAEEYAKDRFGCFHPRCGMCGGRRRG